MTRANALYVVGKLRRMGYRAGIRQTVRGLQSWEITGTDAPAQIVKRETAQMEYREGSLARSNALRDARNYTINGRPDFKRIMRDMAMGKIPGVHVSIKGEEQG